MVATAQRQVEAYAPLRAQTVSSDDSDALKSLKGIATPGIVNRATCYVVENENLYRWFEESLAAESLPAVVRPDDVEPADPGRWIVEAGGGGGGGATEVVVESEADLPAPVGGVITLGAFCYVIRGDVTISTGIQIEIVSGAVLRGDDRACSTLTGSTSAGSPFLFAAAGVRVIVSDLTVINQDTGLVLSHDNGLELLELTRVALDGNANGPCLSFGLEPLVVLTDVRIANYGTSVGITVSGAVAEVRFEHGAVDPFGDAGVAISVEANITIVLFLSDVVLADGDFGVVVAAGVTVGTLSMLGVRLDDYDFDALDIDGTITNLQIDGSFFRNVGAAINLDAGATVTNALVAGSLFSAAPLSGVAFNTPGWEFCCNLGVQNTAAAGGMHTVASVLLAASGLLSADAGIQAALVLDGGSSLFALGTGADAGKLVYTGTKMVQGKVTAVIAASIAVAANVAFHIFVNGVAVKVATTVNVQTTLGVVVVEATVTLPPGATLDVNVGSIITVGSYSLNAVAAAA